MRITVVGAYGYTGFLICEELKKANIRFSICGRNKEKLENLKAQNPATIDAWALNIRQADDVEKLLDSSDLLINCAGPFTEESGLLAEQAARKGKAYVDISGEIGFVKDSKIALHNLATQQGAVLIHGCAFESIVADLLIQHLVAHHTEVHSCRTFYWFNQKKISPGTRLTMKLAKYRALFHISAGRWQKGNFITEQLKVRWEDEPNGYTAVPYPLPEIAFAHWNYTPTFAGSYLLLKNEEAMFVGMPAKPSEPIIDTLDKLRTHKTSGPTHDELAQQKSLIAVDIVYADGTTSQAVVQANNMYHTTAKAICLSVQRIRTARATLMGVLSPAQLFHGSELQTLAALNVEFLPHKKLVMSHV